jgi:uncharacterized DUF497 family protein
MDFDWNEDKNEYLKQQRGVCFEDVVVAINNGTVLDVIEHPDPDKYPSQKIYIIQLEGYVYMVPFIVQTDTIFLKTIIPSRKMKKIYGGGEND